MTARRRRRGQRTPEDVGMVPAAICAWFAGETSQPWEAILPGGYELVPEWWAAWLEAYPGATPPADAMPHQFPPA